MNGWTVLSAGTLAFGLAFMLFEMLIIFLQAYIFSLLAAVYIELSLHADEH
jgi:F-type H+-transporting ATPase subunit a